MGESRRGAIFLGVSSLLAILLIQLVLTIRTESITWDEDDHLYAGYMSWKTGDFGLNPEHPPLVKLLAALPILNMPLRLPALQNREFKHEAFLGGKEFLFKNDADAMLFRARMAAASLTVLLALVVFLAGREMFGTAAGFVALVLLVFDPNQLAHGALVTTDTGSDLLSICNCLRLLPVCETADGLAVVPGWSGWRPGARRQSIRAS